MGSYYLLNIISNVALKFYAHQDWVKAYKTKIVQAVGAHTFNPSTQETKTGEVQDQYGHTKQVPEQSRLRREMLSQTKQNTRISK